MKMSENQWHIFLKPSYRKDLTNFMQFATQDNIHLIYIQKDYKIYVQEVENEFHNVAN